MNKTSNVGPVPPLPEPVPLAPDEPTVASTAATTAATAATLSPSLIFPFFRSLRCGCYLINYTPINSLFVSYDGTLRVECHTNGRTASGDLYQRPTIVLTPTAGFPPLGPSPLLGAPPNPAAGIPILARSRYRYYLRVTKILEFFTLGNSFTLGFERYRFTAPNTWTNDGTFTAVMTWAPAPPGFPSTGDYLVGDVKNAAGAIVGRLSMGWVSKYLRKATIEIDRVSASEAPLNNGSGIGWKEVFDSIDWELKLDVSDSNVAAPSGDSWSDAEMHAAMLARRAATNLDKEWRYHILAVKMLDSTPRGIMYDAGGTDSNNVPREGVGISSHWVIPNSSPWGTVKGQRFGTAAKPYFRTAVHETGHAMGLFHNTVDNGYMNTTDVIAGSCPTTFPSCIKWGYAANDQKRLRHYPDIFVRPGGTAFGTASETTPAISPTDSIVDVSQLEFRVTPLLETVPLGAPVRVNLELTNPTDQPVLAPETLNMKYGFVSGRVVDSSGTARTFSPLVLCVEEQPLTALEPGQSVKQSLTLLRGREGALFGGPGLHTIIVDVRWTARGIDYEVSDSTTVLVTAAVDEQHAQAARKVLSTPDVLLTLVLGGDHMQDGIDAFDAALQTTELRPHFAYLEAKRLSQTFFDRKADMKAAANLIDEQTVMSSAEVKKAAAMAKSGGDATSRKKLAEKLKGRKKQYDDSDVQAALDEI